MFLYTYFDMFDKEKKDTLCLHIRHLWRRDEEQNKKILALANPKAQILMTTRDPIARLKLFINHGYFLESRFIKDKTFRMSDKPFDVVNRVGYYDWYENLASNAPFISGSLLEFLFNRSSFAYTSNISLLPRDARVRYYDMESIMPQHAFETISNLAKEFDFDTPKDSDRGFYEEIKWGIFSYILPLCCIVVVSSRELVIQITTKYDKQVDLYTINDFLFLAPEDIKEYNKEALNTSSYKQALNLLTMISFSMYESDFALLQSDEVASQEVKEYMKRFLIELKRRTDYIQKYKKTEQDVLEYLSMDGELGGKIKAFLDKELTHIRQERPDIIESWTYYKEFENAYTKLDSKHNRA